MSVSPRPAAFPYDRDDAKLAALEQRVYGLERGVQDLNQLFTGRIGEVSAQLAGLSARLDDRSRTPWGTIVSAMGVVLAIVIAGGQLAKTPVVDAIFRLERDTATLGQTMTPLATFSDFKGTYESNRLVLRQDNEAQFARLDAALEALEARAREAQGQAVPRGEHQERWRSQDLAVAGAQRQIDDLKQALGSIYGARDVIIDLRERLDRVERMRLPSGG
jgi:small-conductance mechanosensitive channel